MKRGPCKNGEIIEVVKGCIYRVCARLCSDVGGAGRVDSTKPGGRSPGDGGPKPITKATASLSGSIHSPPTSSPIQSGKKKTNRVAF